MTGDETDNRKPILEWVSRDGLDPSVRFVISEKGVSRHSGRSWRSAREAGRMFGWAVYITSLFTGRAGSSAYGPASHWLGSDFVDKQFMSWGQVRKVKVDEKKGVILLFDSHGSEIRLRCTPGIFEPALRTVREHALGPTQ